jgi:hypothetical protein
MRGCRGWQMAHGPGDASLLRGLHGELERLRPILASAEPSPPIRIEPWIEHWARRHHGKTYLIAATTHGIAFGRWRMSENAGPAGLSRITEVAAEQRDEANVFGLVGGALRGYPTHGIQYLPSARSWPAGSRLVQWVRLDAPGARGGFAILVKADGRFTHSAAWGGFDVRSLRSNPILALWFLRTFYRHATGFLGWDLKGLPAALAYTPESAVAMGASPPPGAWTRLELPLDRIRADGKLLDGVGFLHAGGHLEWGRTSLVAPNGDEVVVWGDRIEGAPEQLARTRITLGGLRAGSRVRVLFEDRELTAADGHFVDDFRGRDLYQRFGGGPTLGYGDAPVALHVYEIG